jgi:hypothetical protein
MTAPLPPLPEPDGIGIEIDGGKWEQDWVSKQDAFNGDTLQSYAKLAVREALNQIVKKARANDWIEPTCDGSIVTFPLADIEAILKEYSDD